MTKSEWLSLKEDSIIIATKSRTLRRVLNFRNSCITLKKVNSNGTTVYVQGDKYLFDVVKL